jgi:23S rRNA (adenine2503-C2)-methyltransferase
MEKIQLAGLLPEEITEQLGLSQKFRGEQIFQWIGKGVTSFDQMTNLSLDLRTKLEETSVIRSSRISKILKDPDGTIKLQIELHDKKAVETVLLIDKENRKTACVSCQVGCAMKCAFCQTGQLGLARNLTAAEIVEQFLFLEQEAGPLNNIVFMGMGEPLMNLSAIRKSVAILTHKKGRNLSSRRITLSTSGVIKGIYDLADNGPKIRLAVSLTTANPELREKLMPISKTNPIGELKKAINYFIEKTGKRCTLEAALIGKTNTDKESAKKLIDFARNMDVHINLIPWNPIKELPLEEPSKNECYRFYKMLEDAGLKVTIRTRKGEKIGGACGQLGKVNKE